MYLKRSAEQVERGHHLRHDPSMGGEEAALTGRVSIALDSLDEVRLEVRPLVVECLVSAERLLDPLALLIGACRCNDCRRACGRPWYVRECSVAFL